MQSAVQEGVLVDDKLEPALTNFSRDFPGEAILYAIENQEHTTPVLLEYLQYAIEHVSQLSEDYSGHLYAVFLLSQFREKKAFPLIMKLCHLKSDEQDFLLGDCITEYLHRFIASTYDGNLQAIQVIIEDPTIDFFVRGQALDSFLVLLTHGLITNEFIDTYSSTLFDVFIEQKDIDGMTALVDFWGNYHPSPFIAKIKKAFSLELVNEEYIGLDEMLILAENKQPYYVANSRYQMIVNTIAEMADWSCFAEDDEVDVLIDDFDGFEDLDLDELEENFPDILPLEQDEPHPDYQFGKTIKYDTPKLGRNDPCYCGSGKKYKKCCLN